MKLYYGWYMVGIAIIANTLLIGIPYSSFGIFVVPVSEDLGLSRAGMNTAFILLSLGTALTATAMGRLMDLFSLRLILLVSTVVTGLCLAAVALSPSLWLSGAILLFVLPPALQGAGMISTNVLISRWFSAKRARALTLAMLGLALGGILMPPLVGWLVASMGWRNALLVCGVGMIAVLFPLFLLVRNAPGPLDIEEGAAAGVGEAVPASSAAAGAPVSMSAILQLPAFWTIGISSALTVAIASSLAVSLVPLAVGVGVPMVQAATIMSAGGIGGFAGKLLVAAYADRFDRIVLLVSTYGLTGVMIALLALGESYLVLLATYGLMGFLGGGKVPLYYAALADRVGAASFGTALGLLVPIVAVLSAVAVRFAGEVFDRTGGYDAMLCSFAVLDLLAAGLMYATRFVRSPAAAR